MLRDRVGGLAAQGVMIAKTLIGDEEKSFVVLQRAAQHCAEFIRVQRRNFSARRNARIGISEERRGVERAVLQIVVGLAVKLVRSGLGEQRNLRTRGSALRSV